MDTDGPPPPKSNSFNTLNNLQQQQSASSSSSVITNNNNANTNKAKQEEERRQQNEEEEYEQKLIKQLSNLSTQEIKRELEHTHSISTVALRGKHMLVKTLVNARIRKKKKRNKSDVNDKKKKGENVGGNVSSRSKSSVARTTNSDYNTGSSNSINMNHGPDIKTMGVSEIKRELQLYGITTDGFLEKRELEETLLRERSLRIPPPSSGTKSGESNTSFGVHVIPGVGNVKQSSSSSSSTPSVSATQLNMSSSSSDPSGISTSVMGLPV